MQGMEEAVIYRHVKELLVELRGDLVWGSAICIDPHLQRYITCFIIFSPLGEILND